MSRGILASVSVSLLAVSASAQDAPTTVRLSLADAVARARAVSPRLAELKAREAGSEAGVRGAQAARLPQLDLQATYARNSDVPELTLPGPPPRTLFPNIPNTYRLHAGATVPLYTGGRIGDTITAARERVSSARSTTAAGEADLVLETTAAYWGLVTARESARVWNEAILSFDAHLRDALNRRDLGLAARNEVLAVETRRAEAELARIETANAADVAAADLARLVGLAPGTTIETDRPATAALPAAGVEALVAAAVESRAEIVAARARVAGLDAAARIAGAARFPQAALQAGYDYARPNTRILPLSDEWRATWSVGVGVSFTPWDGGRTSAAVAQARAEADAARAQLDDLTARVRLDVTSRALDLAAAGAAIAVAERGLEAATENLRVAEDRYREGLVTTTDRLDAETTLLRAALQSTAAATRLELARARLDRAAGR